MTAQPVTAQLQRFLLSLLLSIGMLGAQAADVPEEEDPRLAPGQGALLRGDYTQAIDALGPLAKEDIPQAQFLLGMALEKAPAPTGQPAEALEWYQKAAKAGHAAAQNNLGAMLFDGRGTKADPAQAAKWYRAAAEHYGAPMTYEQAQEAVYGMPIGDWKAKHQKPASPEQEKTFEATKALHAKIGVVE